MVRLVLGDPIPSIPPIAPSKVASHHDFERFLGGVNSAGVLRREVPNAWVDGLEGEARGVSCWAEGGGVGGKIGAIFTLGLGLGVT